MKKLLLTLVVTLATVMSYAQETVVIPTNTTTVVEQSTNDTVTTTPTVSSGLQQVWDALTTGNTNWYFSVHGLYAPELQNKWGMGVGAYYPLHKYVVAGLRLDWVDGGFWMPSGNAALQTKIYPFKFMPKFSVTPFGYLGVGIPLSGATVGDITIPGSIRNNEGKPTVIVGYGFAASLWQNDAKTLSLNFVIDREKWSGFPGSQYRSGLLIKYNF